MKLKECLRIKTYYVTSVEDAMVRAQKELGPEALLLNTRRVIEKGKPCSYEVVLGINEGAPEAPDPPPVIFGEGFLERWPDVPAQPPAPTTAASASPDFLTDELKKLRGQMDEIQGLLLSRLLAELPIPEIAKIYSNLLGANVDPLLSKEIVNRLYIALKMFSFIPTAASGGLSASQSDSIPSKFVMPAADRLEKLLCWAFERSVRISPTLGVTGPGRKRSVAILVGPIGGGKTTTAAKLAIAASAGMPVQLLCLDRPRLGSAESLQSLMSAAKIAVRAVLMPGKLPEAIAAARANHCVLVDTAGYSEGDWQEAEMLAAALGECPELDVHLVVPGHMKAADLRKIVERYSIFHPAKLLVTKTDEAEILGTSVSEAARAELALSFLTNGPNIPQDIRPISASDLAALGLPRRYSKRKARRIIFTRC